MVVSGIGVWLWSSWTDLVHTKPGLRIQTLETAKLLADQQALMQNAPRATPS